MFYKVVRHDLTSISDFAHCFGSTVKYKFGKWVEPKHKEAPLCVFSYEQNIGSFNTGARLFECDIKPSSKNWVLVDTPRHFQRNLNMAQTNPNTLMRDFSPPHGTVYADSVMLTKEITNKEIEPQIFYKILPENLVSISAESKSGDLDIQYKINEWVTPKSHLFPLMVFDSYTNAFDFCHDKSLIYQCEIVQSKQKWGYVHSCDMYNVKRAKTNKKKFSHLLNVGFQCPIGTVFADAVKIIGLYNDRV